MHANTLNKKKSAIRRKSEDFTDGDFSREFPIADLIVQICDSGVVARGLPSGEDYTVPVIKLFLQLLAHGHVERNAANADTIHRCHCRGWLFEDTSSSRICYLLASPLHISCISFTIQPFDEVPQFQSLLDLSIAVVRKFKRSQLSKPIRFVGPAIATRLPEAQWQDEFYRAAITATKGLVRLTPEFGSARGAQPVGRIDFFIPSVKWGIEIIRDGQNLNQHDARFQPGGAYHSWMNAGHMNSYILLDFRQSIPQKPHPSMISDLFALLVHC